MANQDNNNEEDIWKTAKSKDEIDDAFNKKKKRLGLFRWIYAILLAIILGGFCALGYLGWTFMSGNSGKDIEAEGLVPMTSDFAANRPKQADVLFRLAGRQRIGAKLMPELVNEWLKSRGYSNISKKTDGVITTISGNKDGKTYRVLISNGSAKGGFDAMQQARVEGVFALRPIQSSEADKLSAYGDMTSPDNEKVLGHDVSYVLVNSDNNVANFNLDTLGLILSGEITDWSEVSDKKSGEIDIKIEDEGADKSSGLLARLLGDRELRDTAKTFATSEEVVKAVAGSSNAIGFSHANANSGGVKMLSINERNAREFEPNDFNIATESYPFVERIYLYIGATNTNQYLQDFAAFTTSSEGQNIVAKQGFGAQKLQEVSIQPPPEAPTDYAAFARNAKRMNFDFRFKLGANTLDNKAVTDIYRLQHYVNDNSITSRQIALFGFADNVGSRNTNIGVGQVRAEKVLSTLSTIGINPSLIRSYGDAMPVGANSNEAGRIRNRRVEVWICPPPSCPLVNIVANPTATPQPVNNGGVPAGVHIGKEIKTEGELAPKG